MRKELKRLSENREPFFEIHNLNLNWVIRLAEIVYQAVLELPSTPFES